MTDVIGTAANDTLVGTNNNDTLNGLTGADKMAGGGGSDTYFVDQAGDVVTELKNKGLYDTIVSSISTTIAANVENLELVGGALNGTGNALGNQIAGNSLNNKLDGGAGNDTLGGGLGNDTLIGGAGADVLAGGAGQNLLVGGTGDDYLYGGDGANTMQGGTGNDSYVVDGANDVVVELAGQGIDSIGSYVSFDLSLGGANVEKLYLVGDGDLYGTGNALNNYIRGNDDHNKLDGGAGNDTLDGASGNDTLFGGLGNDALYTHFEGGGDSLLDGGKGNDIYYLGGAYNGIGTISIAERAGEGIDEVRADYAIDLETLGHDDNGKFVIADIEKLTLTGSGNYYGKGNALNNVITGNSGNNSLTGRAGNDSLIGGTGNDTLEGGTGNDVMIGGKGNDVYSVDSLKDAVTEKANEGFDEVRSTISYTLGANLESLALGDGKIDGFGNALSNYIGGGSGDNKLDGGAGDDGIEGGDGNDTLIGGAGNDALYGGSGNDAISGGDGNDYLEGGGGNDTLAGGKGNDTYVLDSDDDSILEFANQGIDEVRIDASYALVDYAPNVENLTLKGTGNHQGVGGAANNSITGNAGDNLLQGLAGNDTLKGVEGDDTLEGGDGNDYLDGGADTNKLAGGKGNDIYYLVGGINSVDEAEGNGVDTVINDATTDFGALQFANIEHLILIGDKDIAGYGNTLNNAITGNGGDNLLLGFGGGDTLNGGDGDDTLIGGSGADVMVGGKDSDTYYVEDKTDKVVESANQGVDTVNSLLSYTLGAHLENLVLSALAAGISGTGNTLANVITGNDSANILDGKGGNDHLLGNDGDDTLLGGAGNDTLNGGAGKDQMAGGSGNDVYYVDSLDDKIVELAGQGIDTIITSTMDINLGNKALLNVENVTFTDSLNLDGFGNAAANVIIGSTGRNVIAGFGGNDYLVGGAGNDDLDGGQGNDTLLGGDDKDYLDGGAGNDYLDGGSGANTLAGGAGNDVYIVHSGLDTVFEKTNEGIDEIRSSVTWFLATAAYVENLVLAGTSDINGYGNTLANVITGNSGDNSLEGGAGTDTLFGGDGDDALNGGTGNDKMVGGKDNDFYYVDSTNDIVIEKSKEGIDTVVSSISYRLGANVENLALSSSGNVNGTGNALDNVITGANGKNSLSGGDGSDVLYGYEADDTLLGGTGADYLFGGMGNDELRGGTGNDELYGESGNDLLIGEDGNDLLDGGLGNDDMRGGKGNDVYRVDSKDDKVTELAGQGIDRIETALSFDLTTANNVEELHLKGAGNVNGSGNTLNNFIIGNAGDNILFGGLGNDTLQGNGGTDVLVGAEGDDRYLQVDITDSITEFANYGIDHVEALISYTLGANLENLTLVGTGDLTGTGNELGNVITGNGGNNQLSGLTGNDALNGGDGNDTLDGGSGKDTMRGGKGSDYYYVDNAGDKVIENANEGAYDRVVSLLASYVLDANIEELTFEVGTLDVVGVGNVLSNYIEGDNGNDTLDGLAGNDRIDGGAGNDQLIGGTGSDYLLGNAGDDTLNGGAGNDTLLGGSGADLMIGGAGNDYYEVFNAGDVVQEGVNGGIDTVATAVNLTLSANVEIVAAVVANLTITGNDLDNVMNGSDSGADTFDGGKGADLIRGQGGADKLSGGDGNDVLEGGLGADTLNGGTGNDLFRYTLSNPAEIDTIGGDLIVGFEAGKDKIDLYDLFHDFGVQSDDVVGDGYLRLFVDNGNTLVQFDKDGGADGFVTLATLQNVTNAALADVIYPPASLEA